MSKTITTWHLKAPNKIIMHILVSKLLYIHCYTSYELLYWIWYEKITIMLSHVFPVKYTAYTFTIMTNVKYFEMPTFYINVIPECCNNKSHPWNIKITKIFSSQFWKNCCLLSKSCCTYLKTKNKKRCIFQFCWNLLRNL